MALRLIQIFDESDTKINLAWESEYLQTIDGKSHIKEIMRKWPYSNDGIIYAEISQFGGIVEERIIMFRTLESVEQPRFYRQSEPISGRFMKLENY